MMTKVERRAFEYQLIKKVASFGEPISHKQVIPWPGRTHNEVYGTLRRLVADGYLAKAGHDKYYKARKRMPALGTIHWVEMSKPEPVTTIPVQYLPTTYRSDTEFNISVGLWIVLFLSLLCIISLVIVVAL